MVLVLSGVVTAFSQYRAPGDSSRFHQISRPDPNWDRTTGFPWSGWACSFRSPFSFGLRCSAATSTPSGLIPAPLWASGLPYVRVVFAAHILSSLFAVLSAFLLVGFVGFGSLSIGADLALNSLAAVILGGVTFGSGKGGMLGPAVAAFMCWSSASIFLTSFGLGEPGKEMTQGAIIALAAIAYASRTLPPVRYVHYRSHRHQLMEHEAEETE